MPRKKKPAQEIETPSVAPVSNDTQQQILLLKTLFGDVPHDEGAVLISTQNRGADGEPLMWREAAAVIPIRAADAQGEEWFDDLVTRVSAVSGSGSNDIYFCVTPRLADDAAVSNIRRADHTHSITSLWADFDKATSSAGKTAERAWETYEEIMGFTFAQGVPEPTLVVESGNGWHLYWVLDEPVPWGEDGRAEKLLARWGAYLMGAAAQEGKHLDHVFDPSRVLRLPGTLNWKGGWTNPQPVELMASGGSSWKRYGYNELDDLLPEYSEESLPSSELGNWKYLGAQDVADFLESLSTRPPSPEGRTLTKASKLALKKSDQGGRHASAYTVLAKVIQQHKFDVDVLGTVEELGAIWKEIKPDAERNEWRNLVTHVASRRRAEHDLKAQSKVEVEAIPKMTEAEEANSDAGLPLEHQWGTPVLGTPRENRDPDSIPSFPTEVLPQVMQDIVKEVARDVQVAEALPALAALGSAAAATAGGFVVSLSPTWEETMALYLIGVADPSERKTATIKPFQKSIYEATKVQIESTRDERIKYEVRGKTLEARVKETAKNAANDEQAHITAMTELDIHVTAGDIQHLIQPSIVHSDTTQEALVMSMAQQNGVAWVSSSEGAFVANLAGRYSSGQGVIDLSLINEAYSGSVIRSSRVTRGDSVVQNPHLVITAFIQPSVANLLGRSEFQSTGFLSRVLFSDPSSHVGARDTTLKQRLMGDASLLKAQDAWDAVISQIFVSGWGNQSRPRKLTMTLEAKELFSEFWATAEARAPGSAWWGKAHGHLARIAGVLAVVSNPLSMQIEAEHVAAGIEVIHYFAAGNESLQEDVVEGTAGVYQEWDKEDRRLLRLLADRIKDGRLDTQVTAREVQRFLTMRSEDCEVICHRLVEKGWLAEVETGRTGRKAYELHPKLIHYYELTNGVNGLGKCQNPLSDSSQKSLTHLTPFEESSQSVRSVRDNIEVSESVSDSDSSSQERDNGVVSAVSEPLSTYMDKPIAMGFEREREREKNIDTSRALEGNAPTPTYITPPKSSDTLTVDEVGAHVAVEKGAAEGIVRGKLEAAAAEIVATPEMQESIKKWAPTPPPPKCIKCGGFIMSGKCVGCGAETKGEK